MSMLDDILAKLSESNVSDAKIKELCEAAKVLAAVSDNTTEAKEFVDRIMSAANAKLNNKDIESVDKIKNIGQFRTAVEVYFSRPTNMEKELALAEKLCDLSEKEDGKAVFMAVRDLVSNNAVLNGGLKDEHSEWYKEHFAGYIASAYACSVDNTKYTSAMAVEMLSTLNDLSEHMSNPSAAFANCAVCLEDKRVAELFVKASTKALAIEEEQGNDIFDIGAENLIKAYKEIVKHHPEMAKSCRDCVARTVELVGNTSGGERDVYKAAADFSHSVNENPKVSEYERSMARVRENGYNKKVEKFGKINIKAKEKNKNQEFDFSRDFGYGR